MTTPAERSKRYRDRLRGGPARVPQPCGTTAAYARHLRHGETPCDACRKANAERHRALYAKRRQ